MPSRAVFSTTGEHHAGTAGTMDSETSPILGPAAVRSGGWALSLGITLDGFTGHLGPWTTWKNAWQNLIQDRYWVCSPTFWIPSSLALQQHYIHCLFKTKSLLRQNILYSRVFFFWQIDVLLEPPLVSTYGKLPSLLKVPLCFHNTLFPAPVPTTDLLFWETCCFWEICGSGTIR